MNEALIVFKYQTLPLLKYLFSSCLLYNYAVFSFICIQYLRNNVLM